MRTSRMAMGVIGLLSALVGCGEGTLKFVTAAQQEADPDSLVLTSFSATAARAGSIGATRITWTWSFANISSPTPECSVDHGVGRVTNGSETVVTLTQDTVFTLTCTSADGSDTAVKTIKALPDDSPDPTPVCGPDNCGGCCDEDAVCQLGTGDALCGSLGAACVDCTPSSGSCESNHCTNCTADCSDKTCGESDGCGDTCKAGTGCCEPQCSGVICGASDGCGSSCQKGSGCCEPSCSNKTCGEPDGCDGACNAGSGCCEPRCSGKTCGAPDGCDGTCNQGNGCCKPACEGKICGASDGCNGTCKAGSGCCTRKCLGKICGASDGCDGTCKAGSGCCTPNCSGKICGASDGCDGTCKAGSGCTVCSTSPCDLMQQCGCKADQACHTTYQPDGATKCRAIEGNGMELTPCTKSEQCAKGFLCQGDKEFKWTRCRRFCRTDDDCPHKYDICRPLNSGTVANTKYCTSPCDPMNLSTPDCPSGWQCHALTASASGRHHPECSKIGTVQILDPCTSAADCSLGLNCVFFANGGKCMQECTMAPTVSYCSPWTTCHSYVNKITFGGIEYGFCDF